MVLPLFSQVLAPHSFSLLDVLHIGRELVKRLMYIHLKGLIHRDVKPANFMFNNDKTKIYIIDFGFCKKYKDENGKHIMMNVDKKMIGTPNYVSLNVHDGKEPSRRDDLESIAYIMLYLFNGSLDWDKQDMEIMREMKENLIYSSRCPTMMKSYIVYCRQLRFEEDPNYDKICNILQIE